MNQERKQFITEIAPRSLLASSILAFASILPDYSELKINTVPFAKPIEKELFSQKLLPAHEPENNIISESQLSTEKIKKPPTVYWVFAHPDDETLASAGAMKESQDAGNRNAVVIISSGENTAVGPRLGLTKSQTAQARAKEFVAALDVIGINDIRIIGVPDGQVTVDFVKDIVENLIKETEGEVSFRGHSPYDSYLGLPCGHLDHCAIGNALVKLWQEGQIDNLKLYRIGHLFDGSRLGNCQMLNLNQSEAKQTMRKEYSLVNPDQGRYGIATQSVPGAWAKTETQPECFDLPTNKEF